MTRKTHDVKSVTSKFFTQEEQNTHEKHSKSDKPDTQATSDADMTPEQAAAIIKQSMKILEDFKPQRGRPKKSEEEKLRGYRYNLNLDRDLQQYLKETAWKNRTSITQYINDLIRADMETYFKECEEKGIDPKEGWEVYEP